MVKGHTKEANGTKYALRVSRLWGLRHRCRRLVGNIPIQSPSLNFERDGGGSQLRGGFEGGCRGLLVFLPPSRERGKRLWVFVERARGGLGCERWREEDHRWGEFPQGRGGRSVGEGFGLRGGGGRARCSYEVVGGGLDTVARWLRERQRRVYGARIIWRRGEKVILIHAVIVLIK